MVGLDYYGEFAVIAPLLALRARLRAAGFADDDLCIVLPPGVLVGVTAAYGLPIVRADIPAPMLAITPDLPDPRGSAI